MERRKKPTVLKLLTFPPDFFASPIKNKICLIFLPYLGFLTIQKYIHFATFT